MKIVATIGLDIAKQVFQVHGAGKSGRPVLRRKLRRIEVAHFFSEVPYCLVGIEASGSAHYWARVIGGLGHTVRVGEGMPIRRARLAQLTDQGAFPDTG